MVEGFNLRESTMRWRSCASVHRLPAPLRLGARSPWKRSSGKGPLWQSRHRPTWRFATIARPRTGSPFAPVSESGIESRGKSWAAAAVAESNAAAARILSTSQTRVMPWFFSGKLRMRFPVARKNAFSTAGAATQIVGSPTPPQNPPEGITIDSTLGICAMRIEL